jgi:hypothetical protein
VDDAHVDTTVGGLYADDAQVYGSVALVYLSGGTVGRPVIQRFTC